MSPHIKELPEELIAKIAAGEVIERPASVLKELIENSLDAGATQISIAIEGAGRTRLLVSDNGCGMTKADLLLAIKRHATSKISQLDDLETIATYGFRGEALPSIGAVSRFRMMSRSADDDSAWQIDVEGGKIKGQKPVAREVGTTIEVQDLFFNTPARFKFLKSDATERAQCVRVVEEIAFAAPRTGFQLTIEEASPIIFPPHEASSLEQMPLALKARVWEAWGSRFAKGWEVVSYQQPHVHIWGVVSDAGHHQATAKNQVLFVNRRPVQNRRLTRAVYEGFCLWMWIRGRSMSMFTRRRKK